MTKLPKIKSMKDMIVTLKADKEPLASQDFFELFSIEVDGRTLAPSEIINGAKAMEYRHSKTLQDKAIRELLRNGTLNITMTDNHSDLEEV